MAKNPYLKQHKAFCERLERDRDTMPPDLLVAAERFKLALWAAAHNPAPLPGFAAELAAFMRAGTHALYASTLISLGFGPHRDTERMKREG